MLQRSMALVMLLFLLNGCAILYRVQLGDIENSTEFVKVPIEVKVSEIGVDLKQVENLTRSAGTRQGDQAGDIAKTIQYFQMGPRTGVPVYTDKYAQKIVYQLHTQCPSGKITGITSIREARDYSVIKGEIVKVTGFCLRPRTQANN